MTGGWPMRPAKAERDASFAAFMDQTGPALLRTAWFLTGDADHAMELTQAAYVRTYVAWHKIDQDRALAYARRCLVNHKIDVWRATRHEVVADFTSPGSRTGQGHPGQHRWGHRRSRVSAQWTPPISETISSAG